LLTTFTLASCGNTGSSSEETVDSSAVALDSVQVESVEVDTVEVDTVTAE